MAHRTQSFSQQIDTTQKNNHQLFSEGMQRALTSLGLEGVSLSKESIADLHLFDAGKISKQEALIRVVARAKSQRK